VILIAGQGKDAEVQLSVMGILFSTHTVVYMVNGGTHMLCWTWNYKAFICMLNEIQMHYIVIQIYKIEEPKKTVLCALLSLGFLSFLSFVIDVPPFSEGFSAASSTRVSNLLGMSPHSLQDLILT
jgi:hypothetical protein